MRRALRSRSIGQGVRTSTPCTPPQSPGPSRGRHLGFMGDLMPYFHEVRGLLAVGSAGGLVSNLVAALPALAVGHAVDVAVDHEAGAGATSSVLAAGALVVGATLAFELPKMMKRWWLNVAWARMRASVRSDAYRGLLALPPGAAVEPSDAVARIVGDVEVVAGGFGEVVFETWDTVVLSLALAAWLAVLDPGLAAWALLPLPLALAVAWVAGRHAGRRTSRSRVAASELSATLASHLGALRTLRAGGLTSGAVDGVRDRSAAQAKAQVAVARVTEVAGPAVTLLLGSGGALALWQGGRAVQRGDLTVGALVAFLAVHAQFVERAPRLARMVTRLRAGGAAFERIRPLLAPPAADGDPRPWSSWRWEPRPPSRPGASSPPEPAAAAEVGVQLRDVTYTYPGAGRPALRGVNLDVAPGSFVVVAGPVGSGKTALCRLLAGLDHPGAGTVSFAGSDGRAVEAPRVGYLPQDAPLLAGSVLDNVLGWDRLAHQELESGIAAAEQAMALAGVKTQAVNDSVDRLGEKGRRLSGGERQRVCLARALAGHWPQAPDLLVLDDPFTAVDVATEREILDRLRTVTGAAAPGGRTTTVATSSRPGTFGAADVVVLLDAGHITAVGSPADLCGSIHGRGSRPPGAPTGAAGR